MLRRRHGSAEPARRAQDQPLADRPRHRDDVRQRREFGPAARRARRAAAGRRAALRAGARAQRTRGAQRAARAAVDARTRAAARAHRRQPAAVDDGALQRRLSRGRRWPARAARLRGARVAGHDGAGEHLRRIRRWFIDARRGRSRCRPDRRTRDHAALARARRPSPRRGCSRDRRTRRGRDRSGQLLYEPDADPARPRRAGSRARGRAARSCWSRIC